MSLLETWSSCHAGWLKYLTGLVLAQPPELTEKLADFALYPSLPLNARCDQVHAALNIPRNRFSHVTARFGLLAI
jgi:hypothetical protein